MSCFSLSSFVTHSLIYALPSIVVSYLTVRLEGESWGKRVTIVVSCAILLIFVSYFFQLLWGVFVPHDRIDPRSISIPLFGGFFIGAVFPRFGSFFFLEKTSPTKKEESVRLRGKTVNFLTVIDREETVSPYRPEISKKERNALLKLLKAPMPAEEEVESLTEDNISTMEFSKILRVFYQLERSAPASLEALPKPIRDKIFKRVSASWIFKREHAHEQSPEPLLSFLKTTDNLTSMTLSQALSIFHTLDKSTRSFVEMIPKESRARLLKHFHNYFLSPFPRSKEEAMNVRVQSLECREYLEKWGKASMDFMNEDTRVAFCERTKEQGYTVSFKIKEKGFHEFFSLTGVYTWKSGVRQVWKKEESVRLRGKTVNFLTVIDREEKDHLDQPISKKERGALLELLKAPLPAEEEVEPLLEENVSTMKFSKILRVFYQLEDSPSALEALPKPIRDRLLKRVSTSWIFQQENAQGRAHEQSPEPLLSFLKTTDNLTSMTLSQALSIFYTLDKSTCSFVKMIPKESRAHLLKHFHTYFLSPFPRSQKEAMNIQGPRLSKCSEYLEKWGKESMDFMNEDTRVAFCKCAKEQGYTEFLIKSVGFPRLGYFFVGEEMVCLRDYFLELIDHEEHPHMLLHIMSKRERGALLELLKAPMPAEEEVESLTEDNISTMEFSKILRVFYQLEADPSALETLGKPIRDKIFKRVSASWIFQEQQDASWVFVGALKNPDNLISMTLSRALFIFHTLKVGIYFSVEEIPEESRAHLLKHFHNYFLSPFPRSQKEAMNIPCSQSRECSEYLEKWGEESMDFMNEDTRVAFCERAKEQGYIVSFKIKEKGFHEFFSLGGC